MSPNPNLKVPSAPILKFVAVEVLRMISASARAISEVCSERDDDARSAVFSARLVFTRRRLLYLRDSLGASGMVATRSPAWYDSGTHVCRYVSMTPKL